MRLTALVCLGLLTLCLCEARAYTPYTTQNGTQLRWWKDGFAFVVDDRVPEPMDPDLAFEAISQARQRWVDSSCHDLTIELDGWGTCYGNKADDGINCLHWVNQPGMWPAESWLVAVTFVHFYEETGEIFDTDIAVNTQNYAFDALSECFATDTHYDLQGTLTHEFGHVLGLDHSSEQNATMNQLTYTGDCVKRELSEDDVTGLCEMYEGPLPEPQTWRPDAAPGADAVDKDDLANSDTASPTPSPSPEGCQGTPLAHWFSLSITSILLVSTRRRRRVPRPAPAR